MYCRKYQEGEIFVDAKAKLTPLEQMLYVRSLTRNNVQTATLYDQKKAAEKHAF